MTKQSLQKETDDFYICNLLEINALYHFCKKKGRAALKVICCMTIVVLSAIGGMLYATPSTTFWTPCTPDIQPPESVHVTYDYYGRAGSPSSDPVSSFPATIGLTYGTNISGKILLEYGFDYLFPADYPFYFNIKVGLGEGVVSPSAPAIQIGVFNVGTKKDVTNQNILYLVVGKTLSDKHGRLSAGCYVGNRHVLKSSNGNKENTGFMIAYDRVIRSDKLTFAVDYASGKNSFGGGGIGFYYYFSKNASLLIGPVWFNDKCLNGKMKWTIQLDANL